MIFDAKMIAVLAAVAIANERPPAVANASLSNSHSAPRPPSPVECSATPPPPDWASLVSSGDALFSACGVGAFNSPNLGNGFVAWKAGPNCDGGCSLAGPPPSRNPRDHIRDLRDKELSIGGMHIAGVYNGVSNVTVSHRARIPAVFNVEVQAGSGALRRAGAMLGLRNAMFTNRTWLNISNVCSATLEHTVYAHRSRMNVMVMEINVNHLVRHQGAEGSECAVILESYEHVTFETTPDMTFKVQVVAAHAPGSGGGGGTTTAAGITNQVRVKRGESSARAARGCDFR